MIECKDLAGKVVRSLTLFEEGSYGPEVSIDFDDDFNFNACLGVKMPLEAKWTRIRADSHRCSWTTPRQPVSNKQPSLWLRLVGRRAPPCLRPLCVLRHHLSGPQRACSRSLRTSASRKKCFDI